ncbi:uncharacterized protein FIBRA_02734 [Fibroporia radiculosa]|uniref:Superkiller protein 3 n=1 Tax=Fibroporia radiculosa TaxID=599839 RepID=J4GN26_9APHY|nr:uncharacterized protein FIBRA_02734 [Fibroporia radiculosa]CCM00695.1 predicted protein [Fibroporia radiculosa]
MSTFAKGKLKAAREAIGKKDYEKARDTSTEVLEYEPENYNANVFLGLALLNLKQIESSEQAYQKAAASSPDQPLAWQGLLQLYEQAANWVKYAETLEHLARLFSKAGDAIKCAETLQKLIDLRRNPDRSTSIQLADALSLLLVDSSLYAVLSTLPLPDPTNPTSTAIRAIQVAIHNTLPVLEEIVSIYEKQESETIDSEVAKRRTRLGAAGPEQLRKEVGREILGASKLPNLYDEIMRHPNTSDELRRETEAKLLRHKLQHMRILPSSPQKAKITAELEDLIGGMVLLKIKDELAWTLFIEGKDAEKIEGYDLTILRQFIELFPTSPWADLLVGYFGYMDIPLNNHNDEETQPQRKQDQDNDHIDTILDAFGNLQDSIIAHRIVAELYDNEGDLENTIKVAESGLELVLRAEQSNDRPLPLVRKAFNVVLASSLVHYYPPKHHARALGILNEILSTDHDNVPCLMGRGYVLEFAEKWAEAGELFKKIAALLPDDLGDGIRAKEEHAWCLVNCHNLDAAATELRDVISTLDTLEDKNEDRARCWWRLGRCTWDMGDDRREEAYHHFITALKRSPTFAPAFTALGIYYSEFQSPPDPNRASKCFQKAFELDPRETNAARRLAEGFAEEREWDLVEVVARRTIDGEGGLEGGTVTARYLPINAWAWKAVGVVELNRQNYSPAIQALQIALRTDGEDQLSWLRLGEAYSKAGRYAAALKALERARELDPTDWICSYFIGEVQRQTGDFGGAIKAFEYILQKQPSELGVLASLSQAYFDLGRAEAATAYWARAEISFASSIHTTLQLVAASPGFRRVAWKTAADAVFHLSKFNSYMDEDFVRDVLAQMAPLVTEHPSQTLSGIVASPVSLDDPSRLSLTALEIALAAYEYRISLGLLDDVASGSAHFDLGSALFAYFHKVQLDEARERARQEAINQFKEAIKMEPGNDRYWHALGNVTAESQPKIAQHAYVKALDINSKSTVTWTDLGLFYLHYGDGELANEAFYKAQTLDPDYALAWVGQGLVATLNGHSPESRALFEHAVGLSAPVPEADIEFAKRLFSRLNMAAHPSSSSMTDAFSPAFFVLDRFCRERPQDASALHLFGLVCERIGHVELGVEMITRAITLLEAAYEDSEDPTIERRFTIAHTNVARLRISLGDYDGALESYQAVMGLLPEEPDDRTSRILLTQAQFGSGLANFKLGQLAEALSLFEAAMGTAADDQVMRGHVVILLAQALWAMGTEEGRESAKAQLLQSINADSENLMAINTLAGMGILTDDDSLVDAALSEIVSLPLDQRLSRDPDREVPYLLVQHHLGQGNTQDALAVAQKAAVAEPSRSDIRQELASLVLRQGESSGALAVLGGSAAAREDNLTQLRKSLYLEAVARALASGDAAAPAHESVTMAQKAVVLSPWDLRGWQALALARSQNVASS